MYLLKMLPFCSEKSKNGVRKHCSKNHAISTVPFVCETAMPLMAKSTKNQVWWQNNARNYETKAREQRSDRGWWIEHVVSSPDCSQIKKQTKNVNKYRVCQTTRKLHKVRMTDCSNCWRTLALPWGKCLVSKSSLRTGTDSTQRWIQVHKLNLLVAF